MALTDAQFLAWLKGASAIRTVLVEVVARIGSTETTLYLSNRGYIDGVANIAYTSCVSGGLSISESLSFSGTPNISYGDLELSNPSGVRDTWLGYVWVNRNVNVYIGDPTWAKADFRLVFSGVVGDLTSKSATALNLRILDKLQKLNAPLSETVLGGSTDQKDRLLPILLGECHNVKPLLEVPNTLTYRYNDSNSSGIVEVRDSGAPITTFTSDASNGRFTLTAAPVGEITLSAQGALPSGSYSNNVSTLVRHVVTTYGPANSRLTSGDLDSTNLNSFGTANPQPVGYYATERQNVLAVCQELAASVGAQVVMTSLGKLRLVKISLPAGSPVATITPADMELGSLNVSDKPAVAASCQLSYCKNWTVQTSGLATGLPARSASSFATEYLTTLSTDATVASVYKLDAKPVEELTHLLVESDAVAEAARRKTLWATQRFVYSTKCFSHLMLVELGDAVSIVHPRFGLSSGKTGIVTSIVRDWFLGRVSLGVLV